MLWTIPYQILGIPEHSAVVIVNVTFPERYPVTVVPWEVMSSRDWADEDSEVMVGPFNYSDVATDTGIESEKAAGRGKCDKNLKMAFGSAQTVRALNDGCRYPYDVWVDVSLPSSSPVLVVVADQEPNADNIRQTVGKHADRRRR